MIANDWITNLRKYRLAFAILNRSRSFWHQLKQIYLLDARSDFFIPIYMRHVCYVVVSLVQVVMHFTAQKLVEIESSSLLY